MLQDQKGIIVLSTKRGAASRLKLRVLLQYSLMRFVCPSFQPHQNLFLNHQHFRSATTTMSTTTAPRRMPRWRAGCRCQSGWRWNSRRSCTPHPSKTSIPSTRIRRYIVHASRVTTARARARLASGLALKPAYRGTDYVSTNIPSL